MKHTKAYIHQSIGEAEHRFVYHDGPDSMPPGARPAEYIPPEEATNFPDAAPGEYPDGSPIEEQAQERVTDIETTIEESRITEQDVESSAVLPDEADWVFTATESEIIDTMKGNDYVITGLIQRLKRDVYPNREADATQARKYAMHMRELQKAAHATEEWGLLPGYGIAYDSNKPFMYKFDASAGKLLAYAPGSYQELDLETGEWSQQEAPDGIDARYSELTVDVNGTEFFVNMQLEKGLKTGEGLDEFAGNPDYWTEQNTPILLDMGYTKPEAVDNQDDDVEETNEESMGQEGGNERNEEQIRLENNRREWEQKYSLNPSKENIDGLNLALYDEIQYLRENNITDIRTTAEGDSFNMIDRLEEKMSLYWENYERPLIESVKRERIQAEEVYKNDKSTESTESWNSLLQSINNEIDTYKSSFFKGRYAGTIADLEEKRQSYIDERDNLNADYYGQSFSRPWWYALTNPAGTLAEWLYSRRGTEDTASNEQPALETESRPSAPSSVSVQTTEQPVESESTESQPEADENTEAFQQLIALLQQLLAAMQNQRTPEQTQQSPEQTTQLQEARENLQQAESLLSQQQSHFDQLINKPGVLNMEELQELTDLRKTMAELREKIRDLHARIDSLGQLDNATLETLPNNAEELQAMLQARQSALASLQAETASSVGVPDGAEYASQKAAQIARLQNDIRLIQQKINQLSGAQPTELAEVQTQSIPGATIELDSTNRTLRLRLDNALTPAQRTTIEALKTASSTFVTDVKISNDGKIVEFILSDAVNAEALNFDTLSDYSEPGNLLRYLTSPPAELGRQFVQRNPEAARWLVSPGAEIGRRVAQSAEARSWLSTFLNPGYAVYNWFNRSRK